MAGDVGTEEAKKRGTCSLSRERKENEKTKGDG